MDAGTASLIALWWGLLLGFVIGWLSGTDSKRHVIVKERSILASRKIRLGGNPYRHFYLWLQDVWRWLRK